VTAADDRKSRPRRSRGVCTAVTGGQRHRRSSSVCCPVTAAGVKGGRRGGTKIDATAARRPVTTDDADATRRGTRGIFGYRPPRDVAVRIASFSPPTHPPTLQPDRHPTTKHRVTEVLCFSGPSGAATVGF